MGREILRFAQDDKTGFGQCHPERSEGFGSMGREILRFAQDDKTRVATLRT